MHIGNRIREILNQQTKSHTVTWLAKQLNCHRVNIYDIFNRQTIDTELLWRISVILNHNFFNDISTAIESSLDDDNVPASHTEKRGH